MEVERSVLGRSWRLRACDEGAAAGDQPAARHPGGARPCAGRPRHRPARGRHVPQPAAARLAARPLAPARPRPGRRPAGRRGAGGERVGLIGDYDVDGATATALMARYLRSLGAVVEIEIPDRMRDGYGPNARVLAELADRGCRLVVTLDTGTTAFEPLGKAAEHGLEVIVVDHHAAEEALPAALAVVNPNRVDQASPLKHLAAVGVTFVVLVAVTRVLRDRGAFAARPEPPLLQWLDLVALGTVCDVVPLTGLNRAFVHQGLKVARGAGITGPRRAGRGRRPRRGQRRPPVRLRPRPPHQCRRADRPVRPGCAPARPPTPPTRRPSWRNSSTRSMPSVRRSSAACWTPPSAPSSRSSGRGCRCCWRPGPAGILASSASSPAGSPTGTIGRSWCWASPTASPRAPPARSAGSIWVPP